MRAVHRAPPPHGASPRPAFDLEAEDAVAPRGRVRRGAATACGVERPHVPLHERGGAVPTDQDDGREPRAVVERRLFTRQGRRRRLVLLVVPLELRRSHRRGPFFPLLLEGGVGAEGEGLDLDCVAKLGARRGLDRAPPAGYARTKKREQTGSQRVRSKV